jgi:hypothetical protein
MKLEQLDRIEGFIGCELEDALWIFIFEDRETGKSGLVAHHAMEVERIINVFKQFIAKLETNKYN